MGPSPEKPGCRHVAGLSGLPGDATSVMEHPVAIHEENLEEMPGVGSVDVCQGPRAGHVDRAAGTCLGHEVGRLCLQPLHCLGQEGRLSEGQEAWNVGRRQADHTLVLVNHLPPHKVCHPCRRQPLAQWAQRAELGRQSGKPVGREGGNMRLPVPITGLVASRRLRPTQDRQPQNHTASTRGRRSPGHRWLEGKT